MAHQGEPSMPGDKSPGRIWRLYFVALALTVLSLLLTEVDRRSSNTGMAFPEQAGGSGFVFLAPVRLLLLAAGLIVAGIAVQQRLNQLTTRLEDRLTAAGLIAAVAVLPFLGIFCMDQVWIWDRVAGQWTRDREKSWDSGMMACGVLSAVAAAGAVLVLLPVLARKIVISLLVLFHFGGILTAVCMVAPPNARAPWLAGVVWCSIYRPYLGFLHQNNAYHFYSPDPGPPVLVWFHIYYRDASGQLKSKKVTFPNKETSPVPLHYQRLLALAESINTIDVNVPEAVYEERLAMRRRAGDHYNIPLHPEMMHRHQFQPPQDYSRAVVSAYVRHIARKYPILDSPDDRIEAIRVYRATHQIITPGAMAQGYSPYALSLYLPFFHGTFTPDGELKKKDDPFLYWVLPILADPRRPGEYLDYYDQHSKILD